MTRNSTPFVALFVISIRALPLGPAHVPDVDSNGGPDKMGFRSTYKQSGRLTALVPNLTGQSPGPVRVAGPVNPPALAEGADHEATIQSPI